MTRSDINAARFGAIILTLVTVGVLWATFGPYMCGSPPPTKGQEGALAACRAIEDNQGLLSILALGTTLLLAFIEWRRAEDAERRERERATRESAERLISFFAAVDDTIAEFRRYVAEGRAELATVGDRYCEMPGVLLHAARGGSEAMRILATNSSAPAKAVVATVNIARAMAGVENKAYGPSLPTFWESHLQFQELALAQAIEKFEEQRP